MSNSDPHEVPAAGEPVAQKLMPSGTVAFASQLEHTLHARSRHEVITRELHSWASYKSWAAKVRHDWRSDEGK